MNALIWFNLFIILMLALDLSVFHRHSHAIKMKEAIGWTLFWIFLACLFNLYIYFSRGEEAAINFLTGYVIEKSLSLDNLFVFLLIFTYFQTPKNCLHKVLFYGVLGAILMRGIFIVLGVALISYFHWIIYIFGGFLVFTAVKLAFEKDKQIDPEKNPVLRIFRKFFPVTEDYVKDKFLVRVNQGYAATPLLLVLLTIETSDLIFAVDSVPAVLAITYDPFIVYTSNIFAILGLRSLFFVLSHLMTIFHYLHYAISFILFFVGLKMIMSDFYPINSFVALTIIFLAILVSMMFSVLSPIKK